MTNYSIDDLRKMHMTLEAEAESAKCLYEERLRECQQLSGTIAILERQEPKIKEALPTVGTIDFEGATNMVQRAERIAAHTDGVINATKAAELIIAAGVSKAKKRSLTSSLYKALIHSDDWERIAPGTFKLKVAINDEDISITLDPSPNGQHELRRGF